MKPKNVLIFGASGQIGRHIIRKLTKNNYLKNNSRSDLGISPIYFCTLFSYELFNHTSNWSSISLKNLLTTKTKGLTHGINDIINEIVLDVNKITTGNVEDIKKEYGIQPLTKNHESAIRKELAKNNESKEVTKIGEMTEAKLEPVDTNIANVGESVPEIAESQLTQLLEVNKTATGNVEDITKGLFSFTIVYFLISCFITFAWQIVFKIKNQGRT